MKWILFISSFKKSRELSVFAKVILFASLLIVAANLWVAHLQAEGRLYTSIPRQMLDDSIDEMLATRDTWALGNSTLAAGFRKDIFSNDGADQIAVIRLGSATLRVTVDLAEMALSRAEKAPQRIIFFVTKDDINIAGSRSSVSMSYLQALQSASIYERFAGLMPVYSCRYSIRDAVRDGAAKVATTLLQSMKPARSMDRHAHAETRYRDLSTIEDSTYLYNLGRNYVPDRIDFNSLATLALKNKVELYIVAPPVATAVFEWQKKYYPEYSWENVFIRLRGDAEAAGVKVLDYSQYLDSSTEYFKDVYHLNGRGAEYFTRRLREDLLSDRGTTL